MERSELIQALDNLNASQLEELIVGLETKWDMTRPVMGTQRPPPSVVDEPVEAQTEFDVIIESFAPAKKVAVIKAVRTFLGLGLKEAKEFIESVPKVLKEAVTKEEAEEIKAALAETEAVIVVK